MMFPMFFFSSALYPLWKLREGGSEFIYWVSLLQPVCAFRVEQRDPVDELQPPSRSFHSG